ncbi:MAG: UDP-N-acetylmuramate dehydrogenase [Acidobacteriaceae bacterium]|nr:UDP-N-acetylmuramate dehydrogenase [Acidobacteriaceae bacterium]
MPFLSTVEERLAAIPDLLLIPGAPLSRYTRFAIGGPAALLADTANRDAFIRALHVARSLALPRIVIGGGTNLVVADSGFDGIVLRYTGSEIRRDSDVVHVQAGAVLQDLVDFTISAGLEGMHTMTGIPGYVGGAIYGNAGAYGHSIQEFIQEIEFTDGEGVRTFNNSECRFTYRESIFKRNKDWIILSAKLRLPFGETGKLAAAAAEIRGIRDKKYPPAMKCAGSIFKNLMFAELPASARAQVPPNLVREGKVPSAWFLEQTDAKGMRLGDIQVAAYHANLIYNDGSGSASDLVTIIKELKRRVRVRFGFDLEEEVQYVGFEFAQKPV